jgi:hypothetical protein
MAGLIAAAAKQLRVQEFRASGTFTVPPGVKTVSLFMVGAGGGATSGQGIGQGGNIVEVNYDVSGKATCAVVIGAGVLSGIGGNTSFDGVVIAHGGAKNFITGAIAISLSGVPNGKDGFGGMGGKTNGTWSTGNGGGVTASAEANTGGGGGTGDTAGGSGYIRAEWYE